MKSLFPKQKNKKVLPVQSVCRNCGTQLSGRYCHCCGQDLFAGGEKTVGEILYHTFDTVFAWDNKIFRTLVSLMFYPGKLTKEFFSGKIVQYVYPAKLFWFITLLFFACLNVGDQADAAAGDKDQATEVSATENSVPLRKSIFDVEKVTQDFFSYVPYITFILLPFFAFLLFILFYKQKKYYANHMIFALHFHSFAFLFFTVYTLIHDFIPETWNGDVRSILLATPALYLAIALYVAYRPSVPKLIWKIPLIMLTYGIICLTVLILFVLAIARIKYDFRF